MLKHKDLLNHDFNFLMNENFLTYFFEGISRT
jgi:hypothetical protein